MTAGHSIAATFGYADGENIPLDLMLDMVGRIAASTDLPVSADLDSGYGNPGETARRAIGVGVVGANVEDRLRPLAESVAAVEAVIAAGEAEGVPFVLNARTDAFVRGGDRPLEESIADAITRGRAYLDAGADLVFVPGRLNADTTRQLVEGIGERKISVIGAARRALGRGVRGARRRAHLVRSVHAAGRADRTAGCRGRPLRRRGDPRDHAQPELTVGNPCGPRPGGAWQHRWASPADGDCQRHPRAAGIPGAAGRAAVPAILDDRGLIAA